MTNHGNQKVLLLGATGATGGSILTGLLDSGNFEVTALIRPSSAEKPDVKDLIKRGVKILIADISSSPDELVPLISGIDVFISAISGFSTLAQINIATAAKKAGVKRFVPCGFATICPPGGVMILRDEKETVLNHIKQIFLPYTFIDVGFWYQLSIPRLPSGRIDCSIFLDMNTELHVDGKAPNLLTDLRDIGGLVARIVGDGRTLNRYVFGWGDVLSEEQIYDLVEEASGEKLERKYVSAKEIEDQLSEGRKQLAKEPENKDYLGNVMFMEYDYSKFVRRDNRPEYAKYLGYLDARELYPNFEAREFRDFVKDVLDGKVTKPAEGAEGF